MKLTQKKSCYVLELSIEPGGARRYDLFTYNKFQHIRFILEQEFLPTDELKAHFIEEIASADEESPRHADTETPEDIYWQIFCYKLQFDLFGGGEIKLRVIQVGETEKVIDLCPYLTVHFPNNLSYSLEQRAEFEDEIETSEIGQDILCGALKSHDVVKFSIDWEGIMKQIPPLKEPLLQPGEILVFDEIDYDTWGDYHTIQDEIEDLIGDEDAIQDYIGDLIIDEAAIIYGMWNEEEGLPQNPCWFVDPDPFRIQTPLDLSKNKQN